MILRDMNQSWKVPEGYRFTALSVDGAFVRADFCRTQYQHDTTFALGYSTVSVYLNDQGREVLRTEDYVRVPEMPHVFQKRSRWELLWSAIQDFITGE